MCEGGAGGGAGGGATHEKYDTTLIAKIAKPLLSLLQNKADLLT